VIVYDDEIIARGIQYRPRYCSGVRAALNGIYSKDRSGPPASRHLHSVIEQANLAVAGRGADDQEGRNTGRMRGKRVNIPQIGS